MATETRTGPFGRIANFFAGIPIFFSQVRAETRKVVWPTRRETVMTGVMVLIMTTVLAIFFFAIDALFEAAVKMLLSLAN